MKFRLIGTSDELRMAVRALDVLFAVESVSPPYPCRGGAPGTFRVYAEAVMPEPLTVPPTTDKPKGLPGATRETPDTAIETELS